MKRSVSIGKNTNIPVTGVMLENVFACRAFSKWCERYDTAYDVRSINVDYVDATKDEKPIFINISLTYYDTDLNKLITRFIKLRGDAVVGYVEIVCEGKSYVLCVVEKRPAAGLYASVGLPAGMMDEDDDPRYVIMKELEEEAKFAPRSASLLHLNKQVFSDSEQVVYVSAGWADEGYHVFYTKIFRTREQMNAMDNLICGAASEDETTRTMIVPKDDLVVHSPLASTCVAIALLQKASQ